MGGTGGQGGDYNPGGSGGTVAGVYLSSSNDNNLISNTVTSLTGGTGGTSGYWLGGRAGGSGGVSAGVYLSSSINNSLTSNTVTSLTGGTGGAGGPDGSGGSGGVSAGVYLSSSINNSLTSNTITSLTGGTGGTGYGGAGGPGGVSAGVWLDTSSYDNRITALVTQGSYEEPDPSKWNTIEGKPILYFYNEVSLNVSNFNVTTRTAPILIGGSTATGNPGGSGGISTGLALINITNSIVQNNTISGFKGMPGGTGGYYGLGGSGGASAGIYLFSSTGNNLTSNAVANVTGGAGGAGGFYGSGGSGGTVGGIYLSSSDGNGLVLNAVANVTGGTGGAVGQYGGSSGAKGTSYSLYLYQSNSMTIKENTLQTADYCLYLYSSSNNTVYYNNFITNQSRVSNQNSNNTWDNGYPSGGNYWSNYTGVDNYSGPYQNVTGSDAIGDTPYTIDQYNKDNYPVVFQNPWVHDIAVTNITLSTSEAYTGQTVEINVTTRNCGGRYESFNVTVHFDETNIGAQQVSMLAPSANATLSFSWNTTDVAGGCYAISANASIVPEEINTADNTLISGIKITSPVRIIEVVPCNQTGYFKDTFQRGTIAYFKVTINSTALIPQSTLITINLYDNSSITIGVVSIQGPTWPGISTIIFGLPVPSTATTGTGTVYANAYTDWPSLGGFPHCPEMSATLEITGP